MYHGQTFFDQAFTVQATGDGFLKAVQIRKNPLPKGILELTVRQMVFVRSEWYLASRYCKLREGRPYKPRRAADDPLKEILRLADSTNFSRLKDYKDLKANNSDDMERISSAD